METNTLQHIPLLDKDLGMRKKFLRAKFDHSIDLIRYYLYNTQIASIPVLGTFFIKPFFKLYNRYIETNSIIVLPEQAEAIINRLDSFFVSPCDCRVEYNNCDKPRYTCLKMGIAAKIWEEKSGLRRISREEALALVKMGHEGGLVLSLEQCVQPYQFCICMCCSCCCVPLRQRFTYGIDNYYPSQFIPSISKESCTLCGECVTRCPAKALDVLNDVLTVNLDRCLGCGVCRSSCKHKSIAMAFEASRVIVNKELGFIRLLLIRLFMYGYMLPNFYIFKLFAKSHQYKLDKYFKETPYKK